LDKNVFLGKFIYFFYCKFFLTDTKSIAYKHTKSTQCRLIKTDATEQLIAGFEVERQSYRHFVNTSVR